MAAISIVTTLILFTGTQGFFFKWLSDREPRESCVTQYGYCKLRCPDCTMCYDKLMACYRGRQEDSDNAKEVLPFLSPCLSKLSRCKARCVTCTECYSIFIECSVQINNTQRSSGSLADSIPFIGDLEQQPAESSGVVTRTDGKNGFETGDFIDIDESLQIRLPGRIVFIIEETFSGAAIEILVREEELKENLPTSTENVRTPATELDPSEERISAITTNGNLTVPSTESSLIVTGTTVPNA